MVEFARGYKAWSISERSGLRFPYKEMVREPGTGLWVHKSESDKGYNIVDHPQGHVKAPGADAEILENIYGEPDATIDFLGEGYTYLTDEYGTILYVGK